MKLNRVIGMAKLNDPVLSILSQSWKSNRCSKKNPVETAQYVSLLYKLMIGAAVLIILSVVGFFIGIDPILVTLYLMSGILALALLNIICMDHKKEVKLFIGGLTLVETHWERLLEQTSAWDSFEKTRMVIGGELLRKKAAEVKQLQAIGWRRKEADATKAQFTRIHNQLAALGFANTNHYEYWQN